MGVVVGSGVGVGVLVGVGVGEGVNGAVGVGEINKETTFFASNVFARKKMNDIALNNTARITIILFFLLVFGYSRLTNIPQIVSFQKVPITNTTAENISYSFGVERLSFLAQEYLFFPAQEQK